MDDPRTLREIDLEVDAQTEYERDRLRERVADDHNHDGDEYHADCLACHQLEA